MKRESVLRLSALTAALALSTGGAWAATTTVNGANPTLLSDPAGPTNNLTF